jgi:hypothetical protein
MGFPISNALGAGANFKRRHALFGTVFYKAPSPTVVKKSGFFAPLLRPVGMGVALVIVGVPAIFAWNIYSASEARRTLHDSAITASGTIVKTSIKRKVADGEVEFVLRQVDGRLVRVIADKDAAAAFITETLLVLDKARQRAHERARFSLDRVFDVAFATRQEDLDAYADRLGNRLEGPIR